MLELKKIVKDYPGGEGAVHALRGVSLEFRESEFVAVLGPSGCGKTTLLNIIGGLDQYTEGDLLINGRSTKDFKDRDWDAYRNHSVGFVFQNYNLIPHQSVLRNVELALTLAGVPKAERRRRAKEALDKVGLSSQIKKKPGQLSGGQMQRVAIARAIVNNPEIILADEPTGALDTQTSIQVMELLKEISRDRLVVMVTHNPELAEQYATRTIRILDGEIQSDSLPLTDSERADAYEKLKKQNEGKKRREKKPSMKLTTSFGLSLNNLFTKKGRTALTSFAGSIGIIGIALILAVSTGTTAYIDSVQEETLSSYPLTLQAQSLDMGSVMQTFIGDAASGGEHENDAVYEKTVAYDMVNALNTAEFTKNDLRSFKTRLKREMDDPESVLSTALSGTGYSYDLDLLIYTEDIDGSIIRSDSEELMEELLREHLGMDFSGITEGGAIESEGIMTGLSMLGDMSAANSSLTLWEEMLPGNAGEVINPMLKDQYDVIYGDWPENYDEIVLVLDERNELDDMALYAMGLKSKAEMDELTQSALDGEELEAAEQKFSYEEICSREFHAVLPADCFTLDEPTGTYKDLRETEAGLKYLYDNSLKLKVTGIIRPKEGALSPMLSGSIAYTSGLTEYVIEESHKSKAIAAQLESEDTDIFTGLPFSSNVGNLEDSEKEKEFRAYVEKLDTARKAEVYGKITGLPDPAEVEAYTEQVMAQMDRETIEAQLGDAMRAQTGMDEQTVSEYLSEMEDEDLNELFSGLIEEQYKAQYAEKAQEGLAGMQPEMLAAALNEAMPGYTEEQCARFYDEVLDFSESTLDDNLSILGNLDLESPSEIHLYASSFEAKDSIVDFIDSYNDSVDELSRINYTDYVGLMMSSVTSIINAITYVLVAFVAVSLVVSSIMIGVITLISVQERTKEIGILRAIGASKGNVSSMFNAETVIIGFTSGVLGVLVTYLLCIPINAILHTLTGVTTLSAYLPVPAAIILVAISVGLTLFSGIIPSRSAARKDPVVALRTE